MSRWIKDESYSFKRHTPVISTLASGLIHSGKCLSLDSRQLQPPGASRKKFNKAALRWCLLSTWRETHCIRRRKNEWMQTASFQSLPTRLRPFLSSRCQKCGRKSQRMDARRLGFIGGTVTNETFSRDRAFVEQKENILMHPRRAEAGGNASETDC